MRWTLFIVVVHLICPHNSCRTWRYGQITWQNKGHIGVKPRGWFDIKMSSYQYRKSHCGDYKNPLHLDVVDRYLRRMRTKRIPDEAPPSLGSFDPPHESQVSIYHNQDVVDSLSRSSIRSTFKHKNTAIIGVSQLSRRPHPNKEVVRSCTCPYGDTKDVFVVPNSVCHLRRFPSYQYNIV